MTKLHNDKLAKHLGLANNNTDESVFLSLKAEPVVVIETRKYLDERMKAHHIIKYVNSNMEIVEQEVPLGVKYMVPHFAMKVGNKIDPYPTVSVRDAARQIYEQWKIQINE